MDFAPCTPLRCPCFVLQLIQMRQVCQRVAAIRQRCSRAVDSRKPRVHKQFVQVTTACGYDDCIVASWSENASPTCVDRKRLCKSACREFLRYFSDLRGERSPTEYSCHATSCNALDARRLQSVDSTTHRASGCKGIILSRYPRLRLSQRGRSRRFQYAHESVVSNC